MKFKTRMEAAEALDKAVSIGIAQLRPANEDSDHPGKPASSAYYKFVSSLEGLPPQQKLRAAIAYVIKILIPLYLFAIVSVYLINSNWPPPVDYQKLIERTERDETYRPEERKNSLGITNQGVEYFLGFCSIFVLIEILITVGYTVAALSCLGKGSAAYLKFRYPFLPLPTPKDIDNETSKPLPVPAEAVLGTIIAPYKTDQVEDYLTVTPLQRLHHIHLLGTTGAGKTTTMMNLIDDDVLHNRVFCVMDLFGDLTDRVILRLAKDNSWAKRMTLIDLRATAQMVGYNPLHSEDSSEERTMFLLSLVERNATSWGPQLEETLRCSLMALAETGWTLMELEPLLSNAAFRAQVLNGVSSRPVKSFFEEHFNLLLKKEQTQWAWSAINKVRPFLFAQQLRLLFGQKSALSFRDLIEREDGHAILICLAKHRLHDTAHMVGNLFAHDLLSAILSRADQAEESRRPVHLYLDEFPSLIGESHQSEPFKILLSNGRRYKAGLVLAHQNLSQLKQELRAEISNCQTKIYFKVSEEDARLLSKQAPLLRPENFFSQQRGEAIVVTGSEPAVRVKMRDYQDPTIPSDQLQLFKQAVFASCARSQEAIMQELESREALIDQIKGNIPGNLHINQTVISSKAQTFSPTPQPKTTSPVTSEQSPSQSESQETTPLSNNLKPPAILPNDFQVRHSKTTRFAPEPEEDSLKQAPSAENPVYEGDASEKSPPGTTLSESTPPE